MASDVGGGGAVIALSTLFSHPSGSLLSAWRKSRMLPVARAAPALSCRARPRGERTTEAPPLRAILAVESVLPPSTTMISRVLLVFALHTRW